MPIPSVLAYDRLLQEYLGARAESEVPGAGAEAQLRADVLNDELGNGSHGRSVRELIAAAQRGIRFTAPIPLIDDALAYLDVIVAPKVNPHFPLAFNPSLTKLRIDGQIDTFRRVDEVATLHLRLLIARDRALRVVVQDASSLLRNVLGSHTHERFAVARAARETARGHHGRDMRRYMREASVDEVVTARGRLEMTIAHGLVYDCSPIGLITADGYSRIGHLGVQARDALGDYLLARQSNGLFGLPRRLTPLFNAVQPRRTLGVEPSQGR